jgi:hypothetical protein
MTDATIYYLVPYLKWSGGITISNNKKSKKCILIFPENSRFNCGRIIRFLGEHRKFKGHTPRSISAFCLENFRGAGD